jgi:DNA-3-methyladenine glycosylase
MPGHKDVPQGRLTRAFFARPVLEVAPELLGCTVSHAGVTVRLTEVEAYDGSNDPGSHAFRGPTARTRVMFGEPGGLYVYFTYGMHWCANLGCSPGVSLPTGAPT